VIGVGVLMSGRTNEPLRAGLRSSSLALLASAATLAPAGFALAQTPPPATPGTTAAELDPNARVSRPAPSRNNSAFAPEPPGPCPLESSTVQVTLNSVSFRGATTATDAQLRDAYAEFLGKPQSVAVICQIRDRAARIIFDSGVLARVEIPEQRIAGGALVLEVIEAHVVNVRVRGDVGPAQSVVERYAEKLRGMKPFSIEKAQRYLLLASDVPGVRTRAAVRPSTSAERGAVDIDLTVTREEPDVFANVQNTGSKQVGRWGGLIRGQVAGYTAYGDQTSLTAFHTLDSNEQWLLQVTESLRLGAEGFVARGAFTYGESRPGDVLKPLGLKSRSIVGNLEGAYPLIRARTENLNLAGGLDFIDTKTSKLGTRDELRIVYLRADGDYRTEVAGRPVLASGAVSVRKSLSALGASEAGDPTSRATAKIDAWVFRGQGGLDVALSPRLTGMVRAQAQYSGSSLLPYEQISVGGLTVGRGYDPAAVLGDKGISGAFELRYGPVQLHPKIQAAPYGFFDVGHVINNNTGGPGGSGLQKDTTLKSIGAGVVLRLFNRANLEVTYAHPLDETRTGGPRPGDRVLIQLTASLL